MNIIENSQDLLNKIKEIIYVYHDKIPDIIRNYYKDILEDKDLDIYRQVCLLSNEEIFFYVNICKLIDIYNDLCVLIDLLELNYDSDDVKDCEEYKNELMYEAKKTVDYINSFEELENDKIKNDDRNMLMYLSCIDDSKQKTINARSGKVEQTKKSLANLFEKLRKSSYLDLRKKGLIHQQMKNTAESCYVEGNAFERIGTISTKISYIRISISKNNRKMIKDFFNNDFEYIFLIVCYGDFVNEGCNEKKYYNDIQLYLKRHMTEVINIFNIFKNDFNDETYQVAMDLIEKGMKITTELTGYNKGGLTLCNKAV